MSFRDLKSKKAKSDGPKIPRSWFRCPRKARKLIANRFMAFKQPIARPSTNRVFVERLFSPDMLIQALSVRKMSLGLWIDLTTKETFYCHEKIREKGIQCVSLPCAESNSPPTLTNVRLFAMYVDQALQKRPNGVIGVHCLHGFNRSGFLIVSYLVERLGFSLDAALKCFKKARPPGIYKQSYIRELYFRYDSINNVPPSSRLPPWHFKLSTIAKNPDYLSHIPKSTASLKRRREDLDFIEERKAKIFKRNTEDGGLPFSADFKGFTPVSDPMQLHELQLLCQSMCKWKSLEFPGVQPLSMNKDDHFDLLLSKPYCVSWNAEGTRFMMLIIGKDQIYVFDRSFRCFRVSGLHFPLRSDIRYHITHTLLDGQLVFDKVDGVVYPRFLIFDIIRINGLSVFRQPFFPVRYDCIYREIIQPREEALKCGILDKASEPFSIRQKTFHALSRCQFFLSPSFLKDFGHNSNGLIFQSTEDPYTPGVSQSCLKWKSPSNVSLDFRLQIVSEGDSDPHKKIGLLWVEGFSSAVARVNSVATLEEFHYKIIECVYSDGQWIALRERKDKKSPNNFETFLSVCSTIKNPVDSADFSKFG
ncbi:mRNA-capping enzyme-like [Phlebotomus argentipes]|uniref:mRNA-capping enzyme-like n=1 Tax=Phlebotomus argentipes TaxID=94469 RepID=UPI002892E90C|nr:mRNA-capping enzyme-like [Phlebotomus argentipes]